MMLDHKPNGDCVYLVEEGCALHGTHYKPQQCREMDCRRLAKSITKDDARDMNIIHVWKRGEFLAKQDRFRLYKDNDNDWNTLRN